MVGKSPEWWVATLTRQSSDLGQPHSFPLKQGRGKAVKEKRDKDWASGKLWKAVQMLRMWTLESCCLDLNLPLSLTSCVALNNFINLSVPHPPAEQMGTVMVHEVLEMMKQIKCHGRVPNSIQALAWRRCNVDDL